MIDQMRKDYLDNIMLSSLNPLNINDASIEILEKMKFLDRKSHDYKFKEIANQVVVETKDFYYKLYIDYGDQGKYLLEVRKKLAEIYERYGVHWKILYSNCKGRIITIEQREKLKLCDYNISCAELLKNWKKTIDLLRYELKFADIIKQIKEKSEAVELEHAKDILILKESLIKPKDYAYAPNGNIILLDDADFFLSIVDTNCELISKKNLNVDIETTCGTMCFCSQNESWEKRIKGKFDLSKRFFIMAKNNNINNDEVFIPNGVDTINRELKIFSTGKPSNSKYKNEYYNEYFKKHSLNFNNGKEIEKK